MKHTFQWYSLALLVTAIAQPLAAQQSAGLGNMPQQPQGADALQPLSALDSIRARNGDSSPEGGSDSSNQYTRVRVNEPGKAEMTIMGGTAPSGRHILLQGINQVRQMLNEPDQDRKELEELLREALAEYFIVDMEERVREFDKIKARVDAMESKLQTRLDRRYEVVDLQVKTMLHTADGLDFSVPDGPIGGGGPVGGGGSMGEMDVMMGGSGSMDGGPAEMGGEGMSGLMAGPGPGIANEPVLPGYDVSFEMTRFLRFPGKPLKPTDPLKQYVALDASTDRANEFAKRAAGASDEDKLKQLLLAMHNFHSMFSHFPSPSNRRDRSEKGHSWRVALLPLLGHAELYKQYRFDEPWDSESNLKLVEKMPSVFRSQDDPNAARGTTAFQMLVGNGATFELNPPTRIRDITDGTSNTIALVVANSGVPWTKPEDIPFVLNATIARLAPSRLIGMCDGSVQKLPSGIGDQVFTALATRAGSEVVNPSGLRK